MSNIIYILTNNGAFTGIPADIPGYPNIVPRKDASDVAVAKLRASAITFMPVDSHLECPDDKCVYLKLVQDFYDSCIGVNSDNILIEKICQPVKEQIFKFENNKLSLPFMDNKYITVDNVHDNGYQLKVTTDVNIANNFVFDSSGRIFTTLSSTTNEELTLCMIDHKIKACKANAGSVNLWKMYRYPKVTSELTKNVLKIPGEIKNRIDNQYIVSSDNKCLTSPNYNDGNLTATDCSFIKENDQKFEAHTVGYEGLFVLKKEKDSSKSVSVSSDNKLKVGSNESLFYKDVNKIRYLHDPSKCIGSSGGNISMVPCDSKDTNFIYTTTVTIPSFYDYGRLESDKPDRILRSSTGKCLTVNTDPTTSAAPDTRDVSLSDCMNNKSQQFKINGDTTSPSNMTRISNDKMDHDGCLERPSETSDNLTFRQISKCAHTNNNQLFYLDKIDNKIHYAQENTKCVTSNASGSAVLGPCASAPTFTANTPEQSVNVNLLSVFKTGGIGTQNRGQIRVTKFSDGTVPKGTFTCMRSDDNTKVVLEKCNTDDIYGIYNHQSFTYRENTSSIINNIGSVGQCLKLDTRPDGQMYAPSDACGESVAAKWTLVGSPGSDYGKLKYADGKFCVEAEAGKDGENGEYGKLTRKDCNATVSRFATFIEKPVLPAFTTMNDLALSTKIGSGPELCLSRTEDKQGTGNKIKLVNCGDNFNPWQQQFSYNTGNQRLSVGYNDDHCLMRTGTDIIATTGNVCNTSNDAKWVMYEDKKIRIAPNLVDDADNPKCIGFTKTDGIYSTKLVNCNTGGSVFEVKKMSDTNKYPINLENNSYIIPTNVNGQCLTRNAWDSTTSKGIATFAGCDASQNSQKYEKYDADWKQIRSKEGKCLQYDRNGVSGTPAYFGNCKDYANTSVNQKWYIFNGTVRSSENPDMCYKSQNPNEEYWNSNVVDCASYTYISPTLTPVMNLEPFTKKYLKIKSGNNVNSYIYAQHLFKYQDNSKIIGLGITTTRPKTYDERFAFTYTDKGRIYVFNGYEHFSLKICSQNGIDGSRCSYINSYNCYTNCIIGKVYFEQTGDDNDPYAHWIIHSDGSIESSNDKGTARKGNGKYLGMCSGGHAGIALAGNNNCGNGNVPITCVIVEDP